MGLFFCLVYGIVLYRVVGMCLCIYTWVSFPMHADSDHGSQTPSHLIYSSLFGRSVVRRVDATRTITRHSLHLVPVGIAHLCLSSHANT